MGHGPYSSESRLVRATSLGYDTKSAREIFTERNLNSEMSPYGVILRESRDSIEHPESVSIILGLDVTGSMGSIPHFLVKEGLPLIMSTIIEKGIPDPQILFLGIGDHECDRHPLQIGQFESSDVLLDHWLTKVFLEGGGGSNDGESYLLAWYVAGFHTSIDSIEKRGRKGFLFTVGDEPTLKSISSSSVEKLMGPGQYFNYTHTELLQEAQKKYEVFHLHIKQTNAGSRESTITDWQNILGDHLIEVERREDVAKIISETVLKYSQQTNIIL